MNRFNLTFSGEIVDGHDTEMVKQQFARLFSIDDAAQLERFFSGETIVLHRDLERKHAAQHYHELQLLGMVAALVKVTASEMADRVVNTPKQNPPSVRTASKTSATKPDVTTVWSENEDDFAAQIKARKLASQQLAAREKALREEEQRQIEIVSAHEQALLDERTRLAEEARAQEEAERARLAAQESARKAAEQAEIERLEAEEIARKKAAKEAAKRKAAEETAQRKAQRLKQKAEKAQQKAEDAARRKAQLAKKKRLAAETAARQKAELKEKKRLAAEAAARKKAELEAQQRLAAEEAARKAALEEKKRLAAEEEARLNAELETQKRLAAEKKAHRKAELEKQQRLAEQAQARHKAEQKERKRIAAEEATRKAEAAEDARLQAELQAIKRTQEHEAAKLQAALDEQARQAAAQAAAQAANIKAEAARLLEEAQRQSAERRRLATQDSAAQEVSEEQPLPRSLDDAATSPKKDETVHPRSPKRDKKTVKTLLDVPLRKKGETPQIGVPGRRKRQSGEPNLYALQPFRNAEAVRLRGTLARKNMRRAYTLAILALAVLLIVSGSFYRSDFRPLLSGANAIAINAKSQPVLLAGDSLLLHDRAGISTTEIALSTLGIDHLRPPLVFDSSDTLFARGRLTADSVGSSESETHSLQLLRCDLTLQTCAPFSVQLANNEVGTFVVNPIDGSVLLADPTTSELLKLDRNGTITARASIPIPTMPVLQLHSGLLLMNGLEGPAISVFRYEDDAFGTQLDEVLLLPPTQGTIAPSYVSDFVWSGNAWWVYLEDMASQAGAVHRFDQDWTYLDTVVPNTQGKPLQLINWGQKTLINNPLQPVVRRYNEQGTAEVPFASTQLKARVATEQQSAWRSATIWRGALLLSASAALLGFVLGYFHQTRALVYHTRREQGAAPLDNYLEDLDWIEPVPKRTQQLRRVGIRYGLAALGVLLLAVALNVSATQMAALILVLSGPAIALVLLSRQPVGNIGAFNDKLVLVDHSGHYHLASGSRLHYRGPFLMIDDIIVFSGNRFLPAFAPRPVEQRIRPLVLGGIKVDNKTIAIKLLECRHPLALGALAIVTAITAAAILLTIQAIF